MFKRFLKEFFLGEFHVGQKVFWNNPVDDRFREEYIIFKRADKRGLIGVYNENKGERYAHLHELELLK